LKLIVLNNDGCSDTLIDTITVHPEISANFAVSDSVECHPLTVNFFNLSSGENSWFWDFGDGSTDTLENPVHIYTNTDTLKNDSTFNACLSVLSSFGCGSDTVCDSIVVHPKPIANFTVNIDTGCSCFNVTISNLSLGFDSLIWDFGDGTPISNDTGSTVVHSYCNTTDSTVNYTLQLLALNNDGCSDTLTRNIKVHPEISANFSVSDSVGCNPLTVNFFNLSLGDDSSFWDFGDGTGIDSSLNPTHIYYGDTATFVADSIYPVELFVTSKFGCGSDTARDTILVHPQPFANFSVDTNGGFSPLTITISNLALGYDSLLWVFGDENTDDTTALSFDYTYINNSDSTVVYTLCLYAKTQFGCTDTLCRPITVHPIINADFSMLPDTFGCHPFCVEFVNLSAGADTFCWDFGDSGKDTTYNKSDRPQHCFLNSSTTQDTIYCVELIAVSKFNSRDTIVKCMLVHPKPIANFTVDNDTGCSCFTVTISNLSAGFDSLT